MARPTYPEVGNIQDRPTQQSVKGLWDRAFALQQSIASLQASIETLQSTIESLQSKVSFLERKVNTIASPASEV